MGLIAHNVKFIFIGKVEGARIFPLTGYMPAPARAGPGQSQELRAQSGVSHVCEKGTQLSEPSFAASQGVHVQEAGIGSGAGIQILTLQKGMQVSQAVS